MPFSKSAFPVWQTSYIMTYIRVSRTEVRESLTMAFWPSCSHICLNITSTSPLLPSWHTNKLFPTSSHFFKCKRKQDDKMSRSGMSGHAYPKFIRSPDFSETFLSGCDLKKSTIFWVMWFRINQSRKIELEAINFYRVRFAEKTKLHFSNISGFSSSRIVLLSFIKPWAGDHRRISTKIPTGGLMIGNMRIEMIKWGFKSNSWSKSVRFSRIICPWVLVNLIKTIMQAVQAIENNLMLIDVNQPDLLEKKLIQSNASFINQPEMNPLLKGVNLKSGTVLFIMDKNLRTFMPDEPWSLKIWTDKGDIYLLKNSVRFSFENSNWSNRYLNITNYLLWCQMANGWLLLNKMNLLEFTKE